MAVGQAWSKADVDQPFAERYLDGHWSGGFVDRGIRGELESVSCPTAVECVAVGWDRGKGQPLTEAWTPATGWRRIPSPRVRGILYGVSCGSPTMCVAVGNSVYKALAETWDGTSWSLELPGIAGSARNDEHPTMHSVSCPSDQFCQAVGTISPGPTFVVDWTPAGGWRRQPFPFPGWLLVDSVSCSSETACVTVGDRGNNAAAAILRNGVWRAATLPLPATFGDAVVGAPKKWGAWADRKLHSSLQSVSCAADDRCVAVGWVTFRHPTGYTALAERWDGQRWRFVRVAPGMESDSITGISCARGFECLKVGPLELGYYQRPWPF